jgi:capsid protein
VKRPRVKVTHAQGVYTAMGYRSARSGADDIDSTPGYGGDAHLQCDRPKSIEQSRFFYRNNAIYQGIIKRASGYIIGHDFTLQMTTKDPEYNRKVQGLWWDEWRKPEIRNLLSGRKTARMICNEVLLCGDTGLVKTNVDRKVQLVEAEQITRDRYGNDGIEKDQYGRPTKYHVCSYNASGNLDGRTRREIAPESFIFITDPDRPSATRGMPACQASFPMLHRINDVCDSEAISWQLLSRLAASVHRQGGSTLAAMEGRKKKKTIGGEEQTTYLTDLGYALMFHCEPGEEIKGIERNIPGKDFSASVRMFLRLLGLPLGMPLELVLLDWTQSNYSQTRAVLWQAYYQNFKDWQDLIGDSGYDELLTWKIDAWERKRWIRKPKEDPYEHNWIKPTFPWLDQLKEAQAYALRMDRTFGTHGMVLKSLDMDPDEVLQEREQEIRKAIDRVAKIKADTGVDVPWQLFAGLQSPNTAAAVIEDDDEKAANTKGANA